MFRYFVMAAICLAADQAYAQQPASQTDTPSNSAPSSKAVLPMEEPAPGDHWTYEVRDEITGSVTGIRENVVTEVTTKNITVRYRRAGTNNEGLNIYDRSWNVVEDQPWRFSPHDGSGIQLPLAVGKTWPIQTNNINGSNGNVWKRSGTSKVVAQENITTKVGTFETFKIETKFTAKNVNNPLVQNDVTEVTWYAPVIDHWVKRTFVLMANKHLQTSTEIELIDYGRKQ